MTLGLKKPDIDCKKSQDNRVYTWYHFSFKVQSLVTSHRVTNRKKKLWIILNYDYAIKSAIHH